MATITTHIVIVIKQLYILLYIISDSHKKKSQLYFEQKTMSHLYFPIYNIISNVTLFLPNKLNI